MTRVEAKEQLPIIQAFVDGKTIEFLNNNGMWEELDDILFCKEPKYYRIKSEPKYRPFKNKEECWQEMQKHQPFGWTKKNNSYHNILLITEHSYYDDYFETLTFADGTPFGIKED